MSMASMSVSKTDGPGSSPGAPANLPSEGVVLEGRRFIMSGQVVDSKERHDRG